LFSKGSIDSLHHGISVSQDFAAVEAQHPQANRGQLRIPSSIFLRMFGYQVLRPIHLHDQSCAWRKEIHHELADRLLPVELDAEKLLPSQA